MNTYFKLRCTLKGYQENLEKPELKDHCMVHTSCVDARNKFDFSLRTLFWYVLQEPPTTVMIFISNIPKVTNNFGPEALVVAASENVSQRYFQLLWYLSNTLVYSENIPLLVKIWLHLINFIQTNIDTNYR